MKIATWNINDLSRRLPLLLDWLARAAPDVVALQETKVTDAAFPHAALNAAGFRAASVGQRPWNGVALLVRGAEPVVVRRALPGDAADLDRRYVEAAALGVLVASLYAPNGNTWRGGVGRWTAGARSAYKMAWLRRLEAHAAGLVASGHPVVLAGDFNVVPTDADNGDRSGRYVGNALLHPDPRAAYAALLAQGWTDALAARHREPPRTFWDYRGGRYEKDAGLRIDHLLLSPALAPRLRDAGVDRAERGRDGASDHAPVWLELAPEANAQGKAKART